MSLKFIKVGRRYTHRELTDLGVLPQDWPVASGEYSGVVSTAVEIDHENKAVTFDSVGGRLRGTTLASVEAAVKESLS